MLNYITFQSLKEESHNSSGSRMHPVANFATLESNGHHMVETHERHLISK